MNLIRMTTLGVLPLCSFAGLLFSGRAQSQARSGADVPIRLTSYEIAQIELKKPVRLRDTEGRERTYDRAYLVTLKGTFPRDQARGLELYIGDYRVPEYGGTPDGLYFRIYDDKLLPRLEGKEFRYRFATTEIRSFAVRFSAKRFRPFKTLKER
ncbi:MAG: hypothetical protein AUH31_09505 [Armatimonadetes bacterium 13_1_40CM_64_14]|nr:MAG: hypothetical protein AUH31_09505 [Armatimonadetes bacterium 13_1_40CM_64_14]